MANLLIEAHKVLAILDEKAKNISNMNLFISMYVQKKLCFHHRLKETQANIRRYF